MLRDMTDLDLIDWFAEKLGSQVAFAKALGVEPRTVWNWKTRGISSDMRPKVWAMANDHGANLPREWLFGRNAA